MDLKEFSNEMQEGAKKIGIILSVEQIEKFYKYMNLLIEWNKKINLTAITEPQDIILKHFIDSLTVLEDIKPNDKIVDIGTGAGFPGIPISIMKPEADIFLVDALQKRLTFIEEVIKELRLENVKLVHSRAEDFGKQKEYREKFDISISRAVANLSTLSEYLMPLIKIGGKCICMKSQEAENEIKKAKNAIRILGGEIKESKKMYLPHTDMERTIIIIVKNKETPNKYPRKAGTPSKQPIS